jgi:hypothetical protein
MGCESNGLAGTKREFPKRVFRSGRGLRTAAIPVTGGLLNTLSHTFSLLVQLQFGSDNQRLALVGRFTALLDKIETEVKPRIMPFLACDCPRGNGDGTFQRQQALGTGIGPTSVAVADLNADGKPDLVVGNYNDGTVDVRLGDGDGTFQQRQTFATGGYPISVAVGDVNTDGKPDLVVANYSGNSVGVLLGNGDGTFQSRQTFTTGIRPDSVAVADVNGDGKPDLVVADQGDSTVSVLAGNGNGTFQPQQQFAAGNIPESVAVADVDGDSRPDLILANAGANYVSVLVNNGTINQTYTIQHPAYISGTVFQDINLNGVQDSGDPGIAGQTLFLDLDGSGTLKAGDPTAITDANGNYEFTIQNPGTYTLRQFLLGGVLLNLPVSGSYRWTVSSGQIVTAQNFADVPTSITVPLTLPPSTPFARQGNANADYVEALYRAILNRDAESSGLAIWTGQLNSGALSRLQVVQGIRQSQEHFREEVTEFYFTFLGRAPDAGGLQGWVQNLENGLPEEQMAFYFLDSPEYLSKGDKYFVDHMYLSLLGRSFDSAGEAHWLDALGDDPSGNPTHPAGATYAQVITDFLYSTESLNRLVEGYYQIFLHRLADPFGLNSWLGALEQGGSFLTIGQQFLSSDEFYNNAAAQG